MVNLNIIFNKDFIESIGKLKTLLFLSFHDIKQRYRRSFFGPLWFTINSALFLLVIGFIYSNIFSEKINTYLPYLCIGILIWNFISSTINEGSNLFISEANSLIKQIKLPYFFYAFRLCTRNFIIFVHSIPVAIVIFYIYNIEFNYYFIFLPISFFMLYFNCVCLVMIIAILSVRFRDIPPLVANFIQISFFATPVMWSTEMLSDNHWVISVNPFYYFLSLFRDPILYGRLDLYKIIIVVLITIINYIICSWMLNKFKNKIVYWI